MINLTILLDLQVHSSVNMEPDTLGTPSAVSLSKFQLSLCKRGRVKGLLYLIWKSISMRKDCHQVIVEVGKTFALI